MSSAGREAGTNNNDFSARSSIMKTRVDALTVFPRPGKAANEEFVPVLKEQASQGWNAYEVWRTRIKPQQDQPQRSPRTR
jgi:hypothetical protein